MKSFLTALLLITLCTTALAVAPSHWIQSSETEFKLGTLKNVVATNLGDLKLSRQVKLMLGQNPRVSSVYALAQTPDGTIYAATGPEGLLLQIKDDAITPAAELGDNISIFSLLVDAKGRLLMGTGGEKGQIFRIDAAGAKPQSIFEADGVQYIWSMVESSDGNLYAATGPNGQLFQINPDGSHKVLYDSDEDNLLSMISDGKDSLFVGTDPNGIIYRVNRNSGEPFVVYDAAETEISALAMDAKGNVYAATAQSSEPEGAGPSELQMRGGRPESEGTEVPLPKEPPTTPNPPEVPNPSPGEPLPIPKSTEPKRMMILTNQDDTAAPSTEPAGSVTLEEAEQLQHEVSGTEVAEAAASGNAIYRIDPAGFVTEVFRQPVLIFSMLEQDGSLLVATGSEGEIYQVNPAAEETSVIAKVDPKQVMCMLATNGGKIYLGLANSGEIASMTSGFSTTGTYLSPVLDASQISRFGKMHLLGSLPAGSTCTVATRSGNVRDATNAGWSAWSDELSAQQYLQVPSPSARFFQYRFTFGSAEGTATPVVESVDVAYQLPNLAPRVQSITIEAPDAPGATDAVVDASHMHAITWEASDPNDDALTYNLSFRTGTRGPWVMLKEKLKEQTFDWQVRNVADGAYYVKVEASDASANPIGQGRTASRVSDRVVVDNTPPVIGDLKYTVNGRDVKIDLKAVDVTSVVSGLAYAVDSSTDWQAVLPSDTIADSPEEAYGFTVPALTAGAHQIMLRAVDSHGNPAFESINVTIEK